jgi:hypothetical protein
VHFFFILNTLLIKIGEYTVKQAKMFHAHESQAACYVRSTFFTLPLREKLVICRITGTLREDQYTFLIIYCSFLLRMRNVSERSYRENQHTHFLLNNIFFSKIVPFMR